MRSSFVVHEKKRLTIVSSRCLRFSTLFSSFHLKQSALICRQIVVAVFAMPRRHVKVKSDEMVSFCVRAFSPINSIKAWHFARCAYATAFSREEKQCKKLMLKSFCCYFARIIFHILFAQWNWKWAVENWIKMLARLSTHVWRWLDSGFALARCNLFGNRLSAACGLVWCCSDA